MAYVMTEAEALLVAALESDEYRQGRGVLRADGRFCCLGVACDIYLKTVHPPVGWSSYGEHDDGAIRDDGVIREFQGESHFLPPDVQHWLGWASMDGGLQYDDADAGGLAGLNDKGASFREIAGRIRDGAVRRTS